MEALLLKIRRGETPFYRRLRDFAKAVLASRLPLPDFVKPLLRLFYTIHQTIKHCFLWSVRFFYFEPLFRGRCVSFGKRVFVSRLPLVSGQTRVYVGDDVNFFGKTSIFSGRIFDAPRLVIGNRVDVGHDVVFVVNKEIIIDDDVNIATGVRFMDTDAHPRDASERIADRPPPSDEIKPVRICRYAWIGQNSFILKGVTVGEGAVVGVGSVVVSDVPPYSVVMGNPARVIMKNASRPVPQPGTSEPVSKGVVPE